MSGDPELLTVDEVADRLGLSVATIRRRCISGDIPARKVGKSWLIEAAGLPPRPPPRRHRRPRTASAQVDLRLALAHLRSHDLKQDVWVPDILQFEDDLAQPDDLLASAAARLDLEEAFDPASYIPVPKSPIFPRNAVDLSLPDRLAYQAAVASCADEIEANRSKTVYSARKSSNPRYFLANGRDAWVQWRRDVASAVQGDEGPWMAETDITAFFDFVKHELLLPELQDIGLDHALLQALREMLRAWSVTPNTGLPQGPNASRALANFYMSPVDSALESIPGIRYFRFMDDIRIAAPSRRDAIAALQELDAECRRRGLALSTKKTVLLHGQRAIRRMEEPRLDALQYAFDSSTTNDKQLRKDLRGLFAESLGDEDVKVRHARFSLSRLLRLRDREVLTKVLDNLELLAPLREIAPRFLYPWLGRASVQKKLTQFLHDSERNTSVYLSTWILAGILEFRSALPDEWVEYARGVAMDRGQPPYHRTVALNVLTLGGHTRDYLRVEDVIRSEHDPEVIRGALVALARVGKLTKQTAGRARRIRGMEATIRHLQSAHDLPSPLLPGQRRSIDR